MSWGPPRGGGGGNWVFGGGAGGGGQQQRSGGGGGGGTFPWQKFSALEEDAKRREREDMDKVRRASQGDRVGAAEMMGVSLEEFNDKYLAAGGDEQA